MYEEWIEKEFKEWILWLTFRVQNTYNKTVKSLYIIIYYIKNTDSINYNYNIIFIFYTYVIRIIFFLNLVKTFLIIM